MPAVLLEGDALILHLMIQPKASRDQIVGLHGDEVTVHRDGVDSTNSSGNG